MAALAMLEAATGTICVVVEKRRHVLVIDKTARLRPNRLDQGTGYDRLLVDDRPRQRAQGPSLLRNLSRGPDRQLPPCPVSRAVDQAFSIDSSSDHKGGRLRSRRTSPRLLNVSRLGLVGGNHVASHSSHTSNGSFVALIFMRTTGDWPHRGQFCPVMTMDRP